MRPAILFYSFSGNNRLLAATLAGRLGCALVEVVPLRDPSPFGIVLDRVLRRTPRIRPLRLPEHGALLLIAPLWHRRIAAPMQTALRRLGPEIGAYAFASLSGGVRPGQLEAVEQQLRGLTTRAPERHFALYVERLMAPEHRATAKILGYRVSPEELEGDPELDEITDWLRRRA